MRHYLLLALSKATHAFGVVACAAAAQLVAAPGLTQSMSTG